MEIEDRIRAAWEGRISGCLLGKPVEMVSMREGPNGLNNFLEESGSLPLRDYVKYMDHPLLRGANKRCSSLRSSSTAAFTVLSTMCCRDVAMCTVVSSADCCR